MNELIRDLLQGDIPRLCTGLADWAACALYLLLLPARFQGWKRYALNLCFLLIIPLYMQLTFGYHGAAFVGFMAGCFGLMFLYLLLGSSAGWKACFYFAACAFLLAEFAASFMWQLYVYYAALFPALIGMAQFIIFMLACNGLVLVVYYCAERYTLHTHQNYFVDSKTLVSALPIQLLIYILSSNSYSTIKTPFAVSGTMNIYNLRTFVLLGGLILLYAIRSQQRELQVEKEQQAIQNTLHLQYETYKITQESMDLVNRKYHDLKHQIALLRAEDSLGRNLLLDQMEQEIKTFEAAHLTGNRVLDSVLTRKTLQCQEKGIELTSVVDGEALAMMNDMDISTLFGNALDNAIEHTAVLPAAEKRLIRLNVSRQRGFLRIRVENPYEGKLSFFNGLPRSTKGDDRFHGFGLRSIRQTAEKYGGTAAVTSENGWFILQVLLPLQAGA